jgi:hypothetical protein
MQKDLELNAISALDFTTLCTRVADAYQRDTSSVNGTILAHLAQQLIAAEAQPGGPYTDEHKQLTVELNAAIGRLFRLMGHPLPNVDAYLASVNTTLSSADRASLEQYKKVRDASSHATIKPKRHTSYHRAAETLSLLEEPVQAQTLQFLTRIEAADATREIAAISQFTKLALKDARIPPAKLQMLGEANVHSWIAYSIYDHILDKEADASLLPAANVCMRLALERYKQSLPARHPLQPLITHYFDKVDTTSAWELTACRFNIKDDSIHIGALPNYEQHEALAWRSCIHILGPQIVASFTPSMSRKHVEHLTIGLHHYLIARQLGDDIHDWREDLIAGRISAVVALLLSRQGVREDSVHNLTELVAAIQEDFLDAGAIEVSNLILQHAEHALSQLTTAGCDPTSELIDLVRRLERMAQGSIHHQQQFISFRRTYSTTNQQESAAH